MKLTQTLPLLLELLHLLLLLLPPVFSATFAVLASEAAAEAADATEATTASVLISCLLFTFHVYVLAFDLKFDFDCVSFFFHGWVVCSGQYLVCLIKRKSNQR